MADQVAGAAIETRSASPSRWARKTTYQARGQIFTHVKLIKHDICPGNEENTNEPSSERGEALIECTFICRHLAALRQFSGPFSWICLGDLIIPDGEKTGSTVIIACNSSLPVNRHPEIQSKQIVALLDGWLYPSDVRAARYTKTVLDIVILYFGKYPRSATSLAAVETILPSSSTQISPF